MMCSYPECPFRITRVGLRWEHVDTHGIPTDHAAAPDYDLEAASRGFIITTPPPKENDMSASISTPIPRDQFEGAESDEERARNALADAAFGIADGVPPDPFASLQTALAVLSDIGAPDIGSIIDTITVRTARAIIPVAEQAAATHRERAERADALATVVAEHLRTAGAASRNAVPTISRQYDTGGNIASRS